MNHFLPLGHPIGGCATESESYPILDLAQRPAQLRGGMA
jgi:hypothetical protein